MHDDAAQRSHAVGNPQFVSDRDLKFVRCGRRGIIEFDISPRGLRSCFRTRIPYEEISQPARYDSFRNLSASGTLLHFIALASQESFLPTRMATRPSRPTSVRAAPYSKLELGDGPPLQAASHSR